MLPPYCQYFTIDYNTLDILVKSLLGGFPSIHTAAAFITTEFTSMHMVVTILPAPITGNAHPCHYWQFKLSVVRQCGDQQHEAGAWFMYQGTADRIQNR